ncbi:hypothetical protein [Kordiimonas sp.]|uniref:hypothetical protein n=1 Tax=Kordiimonas sp. TaxID=1970157 RepID=UPI003A940D00
MTVELPHDLITKAFLAARRARDAELQHVLLDAEHAVAFARLVDHPYLLPLAELVENECTTLAGARILLENLLATYDEISLSEPLFFGARFETLVTSKVTQSELRASLEELCSEELAETFLSAVRRYRCIDNGYGIVPQRALLEEEIRKKNSRFLQRVVRISDGQSPMAEKSLKALRRNNGAGSSARMDNRAEEKQVIDLTRMQ